jgi:RNA polymerase-binding protein DksA
MTGEKKTKTEKAAKKVPSKTASKAVPSKTPRAAGKTATKAPAKKAGKVTSKAPGKNPKVAGKSTGKAPGARPRAAGKTTTKAPSTPIRERPPQHIMSKAEWNAFIEKMEQLLQDEKSEIINTLIANNKDFKEIVDGMDPKDFADIASDDIDRKMIEMLGSQELKRLKLIESAQTRIKQGKYGHCIKCDKPIPPERLEAIPYALMCIDCKSEEERRNR